MRKLVLVSVLFGSLLVASSAHAAIPDVFGRCGDLHRRR